MPPTRIKFFYGPSSVAGPELMAESLRRLTGPRQTFIYVVPTARRAQCLEKRLLTSRAKGFFRPHLLTFHSLTKLLYRRMGGAGTPISESVKSILIEEIVSDEKLELAYFHRPEGRPFPGLVTRLSALVSDLKQNLIGPELLEQRANAIEKPAGIKSRELAKIYREYQARLADNDLIDTDGMFWVVLEELESPGKLMEALGGIELLIFDGFFDVTRAEGEVLEKLLAVVPETWLRLDWLPESPAFAAAESFVRRYCGGAERIEAASPAGSPAESLAPRLFDPAGDAQDTKNAEVQILECRDRLAEVEAIAAEIKRLAAEPDFCPNRVAVAFKNVQTYAPMIREVFASCGIPYNCPIGRPLRESPVAAALIALLDVVRENYSRESVIKFIRSPYVQFSFQYEAGAALLDGDFLDAEARAARIFRGKETWAAKLRGVARRLAEEIETGRGQHETDARKARRAAKLNEQCRGIELAMEELSKLAPPAAPKRFGELLGGIMDTFGIARGVFFRCESVTDEEILERDCRALGKINNALKDVMFAASFAERDEFEFEEYAEMVEAGLNSESFDVRRDVDFGVNVLPVAEARGGDYDVVFVGGLADGEFPLPEAPRIFYSEKRRNRLGFKTTPANIEIERYLFAGALGAARRKFFISYPLSDAGKTMLKSIFVRAIERAAPNAEVKRRPAGEEIFSTKSLQCRVGRWLAGPDAAAAERAIRIYARAPNGEAPTAMAHSLAAEEMRRQGNAWSHFEGMLSDPDAKRLIAEKYRRRPLSATTLEKYARCPFRFFAEEVAKLAELEEPQEEVDALERGSVIHRIFSRFYIARRAQGRIGLRPDDDRGAALAHIRSIAEDEFRLMPYEGFFWDMERERIIGGPKLGGRGLVEMFIDTEMNDQSSGEPRFFEVTFGRPRGGQITDAALSLPEVVLGSGADEVRLEGRIDRIDVAEVGGEKLALALDYKTGRPPYYTEILSHLSLQIPIYVMALGNSGCRPVGGVFYSLTDDPETFGKFGTSGALLGSAPDLKGHFGAPKGNRAGMFQIMEFSQIMEGISDRIIEYAAGIRGGVFHPSIRDPYDAGCRYCVFNGVCRRDDAKSARLAAGARAPEKASDG